MIQCKISLVFQARESTFSAHSYCSIQRLRKQLYTQVCILGLFWNVPYTGNKKKQERNFHTTLSKISSCITDLFRTLMYVTIYKLTMIAQPFSEQNAIDTKQQENCKSFRKYNNIVFSTPILHLTIFLHIHKLAYTNHLAPICLQKIRMSIFSGFLSVK